MAADSRETQRLVGRGDRFIYKNKIRDYKDVFYAIAGYPTIWNPDDNNKIFNAYDMVEDALSKFNSLDSSITYFKVNSKHYLDSLFNTAPTQTAIIYSETNIHLFMDVAIVKFVDNKKQIFFFSYYIDFNDLTNTFSISIKNKYYHTQAYIHKIGFYDHIDDTLYAKRGDTTFRWDTERTYDILTSLIELEKKHHIQVGGTVDVVMIHNNGFKWFSDNKY